MLDRQAMIDECRALEAIIGKGEFHDHEKTETFYFNENGKVCGTYDAYYRYAKNEDSESILLKNGFEFCGKFGLTGEPKSHMKNTIIRIVLLKSSLIIPIVCGEDKQMSNKNKTLQIPVTAEEYLRVQLLAKEAGHTLASYCRYILGTKTNIKEENRIKKPS